MLDAGALADFLKPTLKLAAMPTSISLTNYCAGVVAALKAGVVSNAPGTIVGVTVAAGPLTLGAGSNGLIVMTPAPMTALTLVGLPPLAAANMQAENTALITYLMTGLVTFAPGTIVGNCTSTAASPGPLILGAGTGGVITGLTGAGALGAVKSAFPASGPDAIPFYNALVTYIMANASVAYPLNSVIGGCPPVSGPLTAGAAVGGIIS